VFSRVFPGRARLFVPTTTTTRRSIIAPLHRRKSYMATSRPLPTPPRCTARWTNTPPSRRALEEALSRGSLRSNLA
jgi:hypothetical protein